MPKGCVGHLFILVSAQTIVSYLLLSLSSSFCFLALLLPLLFTTGTYKGLRPATRFFADRMHSSARGPTMGDNADAKRKIRRNSVIARPGIPRSCMRASILKRWNLCQPHTLQRRTGRGRDNDFLSVKSTLGLDFLFQRTIAILLWNI